MARIAGVNIPPAKRVEIALTYIYGIGASTAKKICSATGIASGMRCHQLSDSDLVRLREHIESNCVVEGDLMRRVRGDIAEKVRLGSYEGLRHRQNLCVRGQRTKTNSRTVRRVRRPGGGA